MYSADNSTVGVRVWYRAQAELQGQDFTLCIILSAMAVECELAHVFFKWKKIDQQMSNLNADMRPTQAELEAWEDQYRKWSRITQKLDQVCQLLTGSDFDSFVAARPALSQLLVTRHPESAGISPKKFFEENLFWRRNGIIHFGRVDLGELEAASCLQLALSLYNVLNAADHQKYDQTFPPQKTAAPPP